MSGAFVAIVGPSGSGKDSIIDHARLAIEGREIVFPQRQITRPVGTGEDHKPVSESEFEVAKDRGEFALTWRAHGLAYGIPAHVFDAVGAGNLVVANLSRGVLKHLPGLFANVHVVRITVSEDVRLARIIARGREDEIAAASRVARLNPAPDHPADLEIVNDGTLEEASGKLVEFLVNVQDTAGRTTELHRQRS
ncbi:phosphonate metabolism protein/1,5-bisphosphokinase (PRPP-forming) PhnN [Arthrobacter glacialis]|uniref:phosphonate metabolism protein/1,5-bisphosphokinase (PRPP-forming) PhnN n=1 Tax=Arthrobacter glacialis TaxID=1664 RepID=UPI000CD45E2E|nr:phosphonate metabolism protein/1,5-bisphosphokinase (PRPP-forming) PhnN [Arthrobacter glacialis]POH57137.1 phosphonate metabolism protein/1,5-bisphosphokinase (PRPP-forming) PhnN [Arthrobacter glacialis]